VKNRKPLPQQAMIAIVVGAVLVFGLGGWFLVVHPQGGKVANLKRQATDVQERIDAYNQQIAAARSAPKIEVADVYRLAKAMPDKTDMPDLLLELSQLARDTGIRFDSISPQPFAPIGSYTVRVHPAVRQVRQGLVGRPAQRAVPFLLRDRAAAALVAVRGRHAHLQREPAQVPEHPGFARDRRLRLCGGPSTGTGRSTARDDAVGDDVDDHNH